MVVQITSKSISKSNRHVEHGHAMKQIYEYHMHCMFKLTVQMFALHREYQILRSDITEKLID